MIKKKLSINLDKNQYRELETLMEEDSQKNYTSYIVYLIMQEKKRRADTAKSGKNPVGRPKKDDTTAGPEDTHRYPPPYKGGVSYSRADLENYYAFREQEMPPLPKPLTATEIKKYDE